MPTFSGPFMHRGFTLQGPPEETYGLSLIDWMADHDLNRLEIRFTGTKGFALTVPGFPEICKPEASALTQRLRTFVDHGRQRGVRVVPAIGHSDCTSLMVKQHPEWKLLTEAYEHLFYDEIGGEFVRVTVFDDAWATAREACGPPDWNKKKRFAKWPPTLPELF